MSSVSVTKTETNKRADEVIKEKRQNKVAERKSSGVSSGDDRQVLLYRGVEKAAKTLGGGDVMKKVDPKETCWTNPSQGEPKTGRKRPIFNAINEERHKRQKEALGDDAPELWLKGRAYSIDYSKFIASYRKFYDKKTVKGEDGKEITTYVAKGTMDKFMADLYEEYDYDDDGTLDTDLVLSYLTPNKISSKIKSSRDWVEKNLIDAATVQEDDAKAAIVKLKKMGEFLASAPTPRSPRRTRGINKVIDEVGDLPEIDW